MSFFKMLSGRRSNFAICEPHAEEEKVKIAFGLEHKHYHGTERHVDDALVRSS